VLGVAGEHGSPLQIKRGGCDEVAFKINDNCISCGACAAICPVDAISAGDGVYVIDEGKCIDCGGCAPHCPVDAISS